MAVSSSFLQEALKKEAVDETTSTTDSTGAQFASKRPRDSSVFQLIMAPKDDKLTKCFSVRSLRKALFIIFTVLLIAALGLMIGLYISQKKKLYDAESAKSKVAMLLHFKG